MFASDRQIVSMYEDLDCSPLEIEQELNGAYDLETIKIALATHSPKFRADARYSSNLVAANPNEAALGNIQDLFSEQDRTMAKQVVIQLMQSSEVDSVRGRMAEIVIGEKNENVKSKRLNALASAQLPILQVQAQMSKAKQSLELARQKLREAKPIEVKAEAITFGNASLQQTSA